MDYLAIDFRSLFKIEQAAPSSMKGFEKNYICIHKELGGQRNIRQIRDKNTKK